MQSTSWETLDWKKHKLESRLPGEISITSDMQWHHPYGRKWRGTKKPPDESESGEWKSWLKVQRSENEDHGIWSHHFMGNRWGNNGNSVRLYFAAAAKLLQSCPTLCDPIDGSPPGSPAPGILQARTLEWVAISFSSTWKRKVKVKSLSRVRLLATPWTAAYQAPPSMGFSRQESRGMECSKGKLFVLEKLSKVRHVNT